MKNLPMKNLQTQFQNYLMVSSPEIIEHTVSTEKVPAEVRLDIYAYAYRSRLQDALGSSYPMIEAYLGTDDFEALCNGYIDAHPSLYRSIRWFGDQLSEFLKEHEVYSNYPFMSELAELEWTMGLIFDGPDADVITLDEMSQLPAEAWVELQLKLHPTVHRHSFSWNTVQIWQALSDDEDPPEPVQNPEKIEWVLWRQDLMSQFSSVTADEAWAIDAILQNKNFSEMCEGLCQWHAEEEAGPRAASLLKAWIDAGLISKIISS